jgi:hypothetical protein
MSYFSKDFNRFFNVFRCVIISTRTYIYASLICTRTAEHTCNWQLAIYNFLKRSDKITKNIARLLQDFKINLHHNLPSNVPLCMCRNVLVYLHESFPSLREYVDRNRIYMQHNLDIN